MSAPRHFLDLIDVSARELRGMLASGLAMKARPPAGAHGRWGKTVAWAGDATSVLASWLHAADRFDFRLRVATPPELAPSRALLQWAERSGAAVHVGCDPESAVSEADCVITDTWISMGDNDGP